MNEAERIASQAESAESFAPGVAVGSNAVLSVEDARERLKDAEVAWARVCWDEESTATREEKVAVHLACETATDALIEAVRAEGGHYPQDDVLAVIESLRGRGLGKPSWNAASASNNKAVFSGYDRVRDGWSAFVEGWHDALDALAAALAEQGRSAPQPGRCCEHPEAEHITYTAYGVTHGPLCRQCPFRLAYHVYDPAPVLAPQVEPAQEQRACAKCGHDAVRHWPGTPEDGDVPGTLATCSECLEPAMIAAHAGKPADALFERCRHEFVPVEPVPVEAPQPDDRSER